jgi:glycerol-3-phosphate O-acyltransferase
LRAPNLEELSQISSMANANTTSLKKTSIVNRVRSFQFHITKNLLFSWIQPTVLGCDKEFLNIESDDRVCYVMSFRSIADLMVVDQACVDNDLPRPIEPIQDCDESRAFFFLGHPDGTWGRKSQRQQSARMARLFDHESVQSGSSDIELSVTKKGPLKVVPVSLFWGHQPNRENSISDLLLSDNWTVTSRFKKLLSMVIHPGHILVQFGEPVIISEITENEHVRERQIRKLLRLLRVHFNHQKLAILGPDLSHRRTLIKAIMVDPRVETAIKAVSSESGRPVADIEKQALANANEIVSHQSYRVIRSFHLLLTWLWNKLYNGIDLHNINRVKALARTHEIVYVPCHRSHIDYLLLSYVLYHNGLTPPHIAAGKNLNLPIVGPLLRRAGAFFMRRSFKGDPLYKAVFDEYLHQMFVRGYSVEYFIEGGRSRTGRMLTPKIGMLSMTVNSYLRDSSKPICFMPVYFGYERILEGSTYRGELEGKSKEKESIWDIAGVLSTLKHDFGKVGVNFGEPVYLESFLDNALPNWKGNPDVPPSLVTSACVDLGNKIATNLNSATSINAVNLVATVLLTTPRQSMTDDRLQRMVEDLLSIASGLNTEGEYSIVDLDAISIIRQAESIADINRTTQSFGDILSADAPSAILLTYYRNNTIHVYALPAFIARWIKKSGDITTDDLITACKGLYPYLKSEFFLPYTLDKLEPTIEKIVDIFSSLGLIADRQDESDRLISAPPPTTDGYASLTSLAEIIEPTLERYYILATLLEQHGEQSVTDLQTRASAIGHQLSAFYGINSPEFFDKSLFATFITSMKTEGAITITDDLVSTANGLENIKSLTGLTLDSDLRYEVIHLAAKSLPASN